MGASTFQFWRYVALPVLMPSLLGAMILLFGNAFGAQATAYQLTGGFINIVPILIGSQLTGDVLHNVGLGYALAMGMVGILGHHPGRVLVPAAALGALAQVTGTAAAPTALGQGIEAMQGQPQDAPRKERKSPGGFAWWAHLHRSASPTSSCRCSGTLTFSLQSKPLFSAYTGVPARTRSSTRPWATRSSSGIITIILSIALHGPDGLLGPAADAARRARSWSSSRSCRSSSRRSSSCSASSARTATRRCRSPTRTSAARRCSSAATSCCRSRTCTARSTRACARWTSRA